MQSLAELLYPNALPMFYPGKILQRFHTVRFFVLAAWATHEHCFSDV